nr:MAG TPA: hypothetical protein [Caudoviricetes sp.]
MLKYRFQIPKGKMKQNFKFIKIQISNPKGISSLH